MKHRFPEDYGQFAQVVAQLTDNDLANVLDCMLFHGHGVQDVARLASILDVGRAGWTVTTDEEDRVRLTERIPSGVILAYDAVMNKTALAGKLLTEAFQAAYGSSPNPNHAYDLSVKAVETLACPAFIPGNTRGTLGAVIAHLEKKKILLPLLEKNARHGETLTKLMRLLWEGGQRHGAGKYEHISIEGARTAHAVAVTLVSLIHEDALSIE